MDPDFGKGGVSCPSPINLRILAERHPSFHYVLTSGESWSTADALPDTVHRRLIPFQAHPYPDDTYTTKHVVVRQNIVQCCVVECVQSKMLYVRKETRPQPLWIRAPGEHTVKQYLPTKHPNVLRIFASDRMDILGQYYILTEYCSGGDLATAAGPMQPWPAEQDWPEEKLPSSQFVVRALRDLTRAVAALHHGLSLNDHGQYEQDLQYTPIIHGDIKAEKVFLRYPDSGSTMPNRSSNHSVPDFVLGGFGFASIHGTVGRDAIGSEDNVAPEIDSLRTHHRVNRDLTTGGSVLAETLPDECNAGSFNHEEEKLRVTPASDLYSLGLVIYKLASGRALRCSRGIAQVTLARKYSSAMYGQVRHSLRSFLELLPQDRPCTKEAMLTLLAKHDTLDKLVNGN